jgi:hypothetical protein
MWAKAGACGKKSKKSKKSKNIEKVHFSSNLLLGNGWCKLL